MGRRQSLRVVCAAAVRKYDLRTRRPQRGQSEQARLDERRLVQNGHDDGKRWRKRSFHDGA
jgi:hypothetical protein